MAKYSGLLWMTTISIAITLLSMSSVAVTMSPESVYLCLPYDINLDYNLGVVGIDDLTGKMSAYQYPVMRQNDFLHIVNITVTKSNNFDITGHRIDVILTSPSGIVYHPWDLLPPPLNSSKSDTAILNNEMSLDEAGRWKFEINVTENPRNKDVPKECNMTFYHIQSSLDVNGRHLKNGFDVKSRDALIAQEQARAATNIAYYTAALAVLTAFFQIVSFLRSGRETKKLVDEVGKIRNIAESGTTIKALIEEVKRIRKIIESTIKTPKKVTSKGTPKRKRGG